MNYLEIGDRFQKIAKFSEDMTSQNTGKSFFVTFLVAYLLYLKETMSVVVYKKPTIVEKGLDLKK
jgi:DNA polymerase III sliding clamp (beta) subunit (PCNA family)